MKYNLPTPDNCEGKDYIIRVGKAYVKSYILLFEAVTLLDVISEVTTEYNIKETQQVINNFLQKLL